MFEFFKPSQQEGIRGLTEVDRWAGFSAMRDERIMKVLTAYRDWYKDKGFRETDEKKRIGYIERHDMLDQFIRRSEESLSRLQRLQQQDTVAKQRRTADAPQSGII